MDKLTREETAKEEGRIEGIIEGRMEEKISIAKSLLGLLDDETIAIKTGLTSKEIKSLKD